MNDNRLAGLIGALTEMKAIELRKSREMVAATAAHNAASAEWKQASEGLKAAQRALDEYVRTQTLTAAKAIDEEWRLD